MKGFDDDVIGMAAGRQHGDEFGAVLALRADHRDIAGAGVGDEQQVLVGGKRDGVRAASRCARR